MYVKNLSNHQMPWICIYAILLGSSLLHVIFVRNLSNGQVPWNCIYEIIEGSCHKHVMYVRNLSNCLIPWSFIYALILMSSLLPVAYIRNVSGSHVTWNCISMGSVCLHVTCKKSVKQSGTLKLHLRAHNGAVYCVLCVRNPSSSPIPWRCIYALILEGDLLLVVFVGNLSSSLVYSKCTYTVIHCSGSLYVMYLRIRWWCPVHWRFEASNLIKNLQSWVCMT